MFNDLAGLFVNGLALPRAQRDPSDAGGLPSRGGPYPTSGWRDYLLDEEEQG